MLRSTTVRMVWSIFSCVQGIRALSYSKFEGFLRAEGRAAGLLRVSRVAGRQIVVGAVQRGRRRAAKGCGDVARDGVSDARGGNAGKLLFADRLAGGRRIGQH